MTTYEHPIRVMADGKDVVCDYCGEVWARELPTPDAAVALAKAMNTDAFATIPEGSKARTGKGLCHDNTERVIVPELPPEPEPVGRPLWATAAWGAVAFAWSLGQIPGALARGLFRLARVAFPLAAMVVFLAIVGVNAPGFGPAVAGFLFNILVVGGVGILLVVVATLAYREFVTRPHASAEDDATVIKPVRAGSHDQHEE